MTASTELSPAALAAGSHLRLILARTYGQNTRATARSWSVIPCLTPARTIGILDIAKGTAWDTGVAAHHAVAELGLFEPGESHAAANMASGGDCLIDGKVVQRDGTAVVDGEVVPPSMPDGWRQIALPTWVGFQGDGTHLVPVAAFAPETWIRPTLVAAGLMTCYGKPGATEASSSPNPAEYLDWTSGWGCHWPHGVPEWIEGASATVLDLIAASDAFTTAEDVRLRRTNLPRGTDHEEMERLRPMVGAVRLDAMSDLLRSSTSPKLTKAERDAVVAGAVNLSDPTLRDLAALDAAVESLRGAALRSRRANDYPAFAPAVESGTVLGALRRLAPHYAAASLLVPGEVWEVAYVLAHVPATWRCLARFWPPAPMIGMAEIAEQLHVKRGTVDQWGQRGILPLPDGVVGGRPAWWPATITEWAQATGRL